MAAQPLRSVPSDVVSSRQKTSIRSGESFSLDPAYQAFRILQIGFTAAPLIAGADKFFNFLVEWENYLAPVFPRILDVSPHTFMQGVGIVELVAGFGVLFKPRFFAYVVAVWLFGIVVNLLLTGQYFDIALRDFGLALGALALGRLSSYFDH